MQELHEMSDSRLIRICEDYAEENQKFCTDYIDSLSDYLMDNDELSELQREGLLNIIKKFHMVY